MRLEKDLLILQHHGFQVRKKTLILLYRKRCKNAVFALRGFLGHGFHRNGNPSPVIITGPGTTRPPVITFLNSIDADCADKVSHGFGLASDIAGYPHEVKCCQGDDAGAIRGKENFE